MPLLPIYTYDHAVLRQETDHVEHDSDAIQTLIANMFETMRNAEGIGLAANQVGQSHSIFVVDVTDFEEYKDSKPLAVINPVIIGHHGESVYEEGCLSLPGIREEIVRPSTIGVRFFDETFKEVEMEMNDILARVFQHEIDHLHGKYFIDYLSPMKFSFLRGKLSKMMKGDVEADYPLAPPSSKKAAAKNTGHAPRAGRL